MRGKVCFQNDNSEMRMARMIHNHTKKTSNVAYVLSFIVSFPEENVGREVSMDGRMRGMKSACWKAR